ncbi:UNVERIFIED_CONTAM: hypothetical protein PYX00_001026 [Menopon gallinae]|uniref:Uncharacterized protein n=1 Tax=Menopon gallinae TaxID=328185 RepID=A0AAW2IC12_9NEOP
MLVEGSPADMENQDRRRGEGWSRTAEFTTGRAITRASQTESKRSSAKGRVLPRKILNRLRNNRKGLCPVRTKMIAHRYDWDLVKSQVSGQKNRSVSLQSLMTTTIGQSFRLRVHQPQERLNRPEESAVQEVSGPQTKITQLFL